MARVTLTRISDHVARGVRLLIQHYREQPETVALLSVYLRWIQKMEDGIFQMLDARTLEGEGAQLDAIGRIVGLGRGAINRPGDDDESYRAALAIRIRSLRSFGTGLDFEEILALLQGLMGGGVRIEEYPPARVRVTLYSVTYDPNLVVEVLIGAKLAGVALEIFYSPEPETEIFRFSEDPVVTADDSDRGWDAGEFVQQIY